MTGQQIDRDRLRELAENATPGPWERTGRNGIHTPIGSCIALTHRHDPEQRQDDAEFIAASRQAVPALLDMLDRVRALHRELPLYEHEDTCPDASDAHREEHHHEYADQVGEFYCDQLPVGSVCAECTDVYGDLIAWPCPTIRALDGEP